MAITSRALAFASRWFDEATVRRTFEPLIADWQREWQDAPPSRRARVSLHGAAAFVCAVMVSMPQLARTAAPARVTNLVAIRMTRFIAVASALLLIPPLQQLPATGSTAAMLFFLLPSVITFVFPFSMVGAADAIRRHERLAPHVERATAAKLALIALLFMIVFGGWVVPAANRAYRIAGSPHGGQAPGVRELTTFELVTDPARAAAHEPFTGGADRATRVQGELNNRAALAVMPVLILWLRWRAIEGTSGRWWSPLPVSLATTLVIVVFGVSFFYGWQLERQLKLITGTGYWLPVMSFVVWGATADYFRRRPVPSV
jgi:cytochrome bd-type quinol oxidase subunit 2